VLAQLQIAIASYLVAVIRGCRRIFSSAPLPDHCFGDSQVMCIVARRISAVYDLLDAQHELLVLRNTHVKSDFFVDGLTETECANADVSCSLVVAATHVTVFTGWHECSMLASQLPGPVGSGSCSGSFAFALAQAALALIWPAYAKVRLLYCLLVAVARGTDD
jgi:hypothetical protein